MTSLSEDIETIRPIIERTSDQTQGAIARLARADDLDELLEPFVFTFLFDIGDMEADGALSRSRHSVVTQLCDAGSRGEVKRPIVNDRRG
jgi:hypothetical protein